MTSGLLLTVDSGHLLSYKPLQTGFSLHFNLFPVCNCHDEEIKELLTLQVEDEISW